MTAKVTPVVIVDKAHILTTMKAASCKKATVGIDSQLSINKCVLSSFVLRKGKEAKDGKASHRDGTMGVFQRAEESAEKAKAKEPAEEETSECELLKRPRMP